MTQDVELDDEDQMAQALADIRGERSDESPPAVEPPDDPVAETNEPEQAPALEAAPATTPPDANEQLKQAQAELHKARSEIGRVGALNHKYMQAAQEVAQLREQLAQRQSPEQPVDTSDTADRLAQVAEQVKDFPELAGIVSAVSDALKQADRKTEEVAKRVAAQMVEPFEPLRREQTTRMENDKRSAYDADLAVFNSTYPTAVQVVQSDEFKGWLHKQPGHVQHTFSNGQTPAEAMTVLDTYDMHLRRSGLEPIAQFKQSPSDVQTAPMRSVPNTNRLQRAAGLPSRSGGSQGGAPPADDFDASLAYFRNKRLNAQRSAT